MHQLSHQASILLYAKRITDAVVEGAPIVDCVIAVPAWFGPAQRQALLDAAQVRFERLKPTLQTHF